MNLRIGNGYDVHRFAVQRDLILGGEKIVHPLGLAGHSDADVLVHAIIDALLGAASLGNIGQLFPDHDDRYKNIFSIELLKEVSKILQSNNISIINIDSIVVCQEPKISPYIEKMKKNISQALQGIPTSRICIKGKTTEGLGFTGRGEGIISYAVALIQINCILND